MGACSPLVRGTYAHTSISRPSQVFVQLVIATLPQSREHLQLELEHHWHLYRSPPQLLSHYPGLRQTFVSSQPFETSQRRQMLGAFRPTLRRF